MGGTCIVYIGIKNSYSILVRRLKGRGHWWDLNVDESMILKWILEKQEGVNWILLEHIGSRDGVFRTQ
jgi:hypothetical protein